MIRSTRRTPIGIRTLLHSGLLLLILVWPVFGAPDTNRLAPSDYPSSEPVSTYNRGLKQFHQNRYSAARTLFTRVANDAQTREVKMRALFMKARCTFEMGNYIAALEAFRTFSRNHPDSPLRREALKYQLDSGFKLMQGEQHRTLLGLPILSAEGTGEDVVRQLLEEHPFEKFSDDYQYRLANLLYRRKEYAAAAEEYLFLIDQYDRSIWRSSARFLAGVCFYRTVESISYDTQNLTKARNHFKTYADQYPEGSLVKRARSYIERIDRKLAEKNLRIAEWYGRTGRKNGAIYYYKEVIRQYPNTDPAREADERLRDMDHPDAKLSDALRQTVERSSGSNSKRNEDN